MLLYNIVVCYRVSKLTSITLLYVHTLCRFMPESHLTAPCRRVAMIVSESGPGELFTGFGEMVVVNCVQLATTLNFEPTFG